MARTNKPKVHRAVWSPLSFIFSRIKNGRAILLVPLATLVLALSLYLILNNSYTVSSLAKELAFDAPQLVNSIYSYLALAGLAVLATIAYYYKD